MGAPAPQGMAASMGSSPALATLGAGGWFLETCADVVVLGGSDDARCVRVHVMPVEFEGATGNLWCQQRVVDTPFGLQEGVICPGARR